MQVNNKKIIVTGAGSGIGKELTKQLIKKGALVVGIDINEENLKLLKEEVNSEYLSTYVVDVANETSLNNFKTDYFQKYGDIHMIINNAGIIQPFANVDKLDMGTIYKVMDINFYGPLKLIKLFMPYLKQNKESHIVNVSSMGGFFPFPGQTVYGASKAALKLLTEGLYSELLNTNIHVTIVLPGAINTNITKNSNVEPIAASSSSIKMLSAEKAASIIIKGVEKNKFKIYVGSDSKIMNFLYKVNDKFAIKAISRLMQGK